MLEEDEELLRRRAKECRDPNEKIRYFALHFLSIGRSISEASKAFIVDRSTIYEWTIQWKHEKTLSDKPREGRPPSFGEKEKKEIKKLIEENDPSKHGFNATMWDTKSLQLYLEGKGVGSIHRNTGGTISAGSCLTTASSDPQGRWPLL